ncbi:hypothetical protein AOLI_G00087610 [Acnodon oligacanthus]
MNQPYFQLKKKFPLLEAEYQLSSVQLAGNRKLSLKLLLHNSLSSQQSIYGLVQLPREDKTQPFPSYAGRGQEKERRWEKGRKERED